MRLKVEKSIRSLESFDSGDSRKGHVDCFAISRTLVQSLESRKPKNHLFRFLGLLNDTARIIAATVILSCAVPLLFFSIFYFHNLLQTVLILSTIIYGIFAVVRLYGRRMKTKTERSRAESFSGSGELKERLRSLTRIANPCNFNIQF